MQMLQYDWLSYRTQLANSNRVLIIDDYFPGIIEKSEI